MKSLFSLQINSLLLFLSISVGQVSAQDFMASPSGEIPGNLSLNTGSSDFADLLEGLSIRVSTNMNYARNLDLEDSGDEGDFFLSFGGNISYQLSPGGLWEGAIGYSPNYRMFFSDQDRPGAFAQSFNGSLNYQGSAVTGRLVANFISGGQSNSLAGGFVDSSRFGLNGSVSWNFSPKTSLNFNFGYNTDVFSDSDFGGSESFRYGLSALWMATPLIRIGPSLNFSSNSSDNAGSSNSYGLSFILNYELSGKTSLNTNLGFRDQTFDDGGGSTNFAGGVSLNWKPDDLYRVTFGLNTGNSGAPSGQNQFVNSYRLNLGVSRPLGEGNVNFQTGFSWSEFIGTDLATRTNDDQKDFNIGLSYSRSIFYEQLSFNASTVYREGLSGREFSSANISMGLRYSF